MLKHAENLGVSWRPLAAHGTPSSKPAAAYLGARVPAEAAPARGRPRPVHVQFCKCPGCLPSLRAIRNHAMPCADRFENPARASMDLARLQPPQPWPAQQCLHALKR